MILFATQAYWVFIVRIYFFAVVSGLIWNHWMGDHKAWCCLVQFYEVTQKR